MIASRILLKQKSFILDRTMNVLIYGKRKAFPVLVIPSQDGTAFDYEHFGMVGVLRPYLDKGLIQLFCIDSMDKVSFSDTDGDPETRIQNQEKYYRYVIEEVLPLIRRNCRFRSRILLTGNSMGGYHAANFFFRRPDLFEGFISLSGIFDASLLMNGYMSSLVYLNSPIHSLENMQKDHPYVSIYKNRCIYLCVGRGKWEEEGLRTQPILTSLLEEKGIPVFSDYWGYDVNHDWYWWRKQIVYFMDMALKRIKVHYPTILRKV